MKKRRGSFILLLICAIFLMVGCKQNLQDVARNTEEILTEENETVYPPLLLGIIYYKNSPSQEFTSLIDGVEQTQRIDHEFYLDDETLQEKAFACVDDAPIDTEEEITKYAWKILPTVIQLGYIEENWGPVYAVQYKGNIWRIPFAEDTYYSFSMRDGTKDLYISGEDGHIILFPGSKKGYEITRKPNFDLES